MKVKEPKPFKFSIRLKLAVFVGALIAALMTGDALWTASLQQQQSEFEAHEKAEVLAGEMRAVWDFLDINQNIVNRTLDGAIRSKTLVCVVAAKSISYLFAEDTDYTIRFVNQTPREVVGTPDAFEERAFAAFIADGKLEAYSEVEINEQGERVFRYAEPLYVTTMCLECHGDPAGELDQYGYEKEGMHIGDIGGALSIIEPMNIYREGMQRSVMQQLIMVLIMFVLASIGIYYAVNRLVLRPIEKLEHAAKKIGGGEFKYTLNIKNFGGSDEITAFVEDFDKMAQRLKHLYLDLESEVALRTEELYELNKLLIQQKTELKEALDRLNEETAYKSEFFAIMSHELRTPLTSVLAFARILQASDTLDDKTSHSVEEIEVNATLLLNMVNNMLTLAKAEALKNELLVEPVDFVDLIGFVKDSLEPIARNKGIDFTAKTNLDVPVTMADWEKLRRIVENLVDNAIKYTQTGGAISISVHYECAEAAVPGSGESSDENGASECPCKDGFVVIVVADDGMGIAAEDQETIFDRYKQGIQSPDRRYRGTGLGLAVVKELTELHGGTVSFESTINKGSTFTVRIPYIRVDTEGYYEDTTG
ncbi:MAG: DUF3365 domain-containing protein [Coriobacteriales bacterium]|jgi:signal transduction histidine kinase|nr:DUF3365 domain-containing protein [Coriobacteriales bacterium]